MKLLLVLFMSLVTAGCSAFGVRSGYEATSYDVVATTASGLEIRRYGPRLAAETTDADDDGSQAFRRLFRYITGANRGRAEIAMTVPVETKGAAEIAMTVPVESGGDENRMRFFLPAQFTAETAPEPTDPLVRIVEVPSQTLAALRFTGLGWRSTVEARKEALLDRLDGSGWSPQGEPFAYFYDPPWTIPFLRRNEVLVAVEGNANEQAPARPTAD